MRRTYLCLASLAITAAAQTPPAPVLEIHTDRAGVRVSPRLYGLMTEEINYSYDGGLYAELVRNRTLMDPQELAHWSLVRERGGSGAMTLDRSQRFTNAIPLSLKLTIAQATGEQRVGIANEGYWGIPVRPATEYRASFYAKAAADFHGPLTVSLISADGATVFASASVAHITGDWLKYNVVLTTRPGPTTSAARLAITASSTGTLWLNMVSLFPPTYNDRPNGNRRDIMQLLADMKPSFLRFPGGNYLEGNTIATRFDWKKTIGNVANRPGHMDDAWRYWSTDGMGLLEFLEWCEDLHMDPVLAVYAGYSLRGERVEPGDALKPFVQDALDEIEYVTGSEISTWGSLRARDGHRAPFPLPFVEIGNEDNFDRAGTYDARYAQFYDAIKARYPKVQVIATVPVKSRTPDVIDEHYYRSSEDQMASTAHMYDQRPRGGPAIFVGEWATRIGEPTPNMSAALGDAAWMTGLERNSDLVIMESYAPLFVNVNPDAMQWRTDLIGYNVLASYGSPAYYAQKMFSANHGEFVLPINGQNIPARVWQPPAPRGRPGPNGEAPQPQPTPPPQDVPTLFFNATLASESHIIYLKIVNRADTPQPVRIQLAGPGVLEPQAESVTMAAANGSDTNTIEDPRKIVPMDGTIEGVSSDFTHTFPAFSISVVKLKLKTRSR
jgi:alpha-N-arabinofuranosidase